MALVVDGSCAHRASGKTCVKPTCHHSAEKVHREASNGSRKVARLTCRSRLQLLVRCMCRNALFWCLPGPQTKRSVCHREEPTNDKASSLWQGDREWLNPARLVTTALLLIAWKKLESSFNVVRTQRASKDGTLQQVFVYFKNNPKEYIFPFTVGASHIHMTLKDLGSNIYQIIHVGITMRSTESYNRTNQGNFCTHMRFWDGISYADVFRSLQHDCSRCLYVSDDHTCRIYCNGWNKLIQAMNLFFEVCSIQPPPYQNAPFQG